MSQTDISVLVKAIHFAANKHRHQRRKDRDATPYVNHPITLAHILVNEAGLTDVITICSALLHDTIEDTDTTEAEIREEFGQEVSQVVMEVTDDKDLAKQQRKQAQIDHAPQLSSRARAVKLADKIANLRDVEADPPLDWSLSRCQGYFDWALEVVEALRGEHPVLEELFDRQYRRRPE